MPVVVALLFAVQFSCEPKTTARGVILLAQYDVFMTVHRTSTGSLSTKAAEVTGVSDGLGNPVAVGSGTVAPGKTTFNYVTITKDMDGYTLGLTALLASGEVLKDVTVGWVAHGAGTSPSAFYHMKETFSNVALVSFVSSGDQGATNETLKFAFTCLLKEYTPQNKDGSAGTTVSTSWNVSTNAPTPVCASGAAASLKSESYGSAF
jgi:type VI protein secretion system component Hcp